MSTTMVSYLPIVIISLSMVAVNCETSTGVKKFFENKDVQKVIEDIKNPIEAAIYTFVSGQCSNLKKLVGVSYEQIEGEKEPDLRNLTLNFLSPAFTITYNLTTAARYIPQAQGLNTTNKLFIFIHGYTDNPNKIIFRTIREALFQQGEYNVLALDASSLTSSMYFRASTYARFIGAKLGEVLAALVNCGLDPALIHVIGHSLGAQISSFTGKTFAQLTGQKVGRITGLDAVGPCFSPTFKDVGLNATDAEFVDLIHTDGGVVGLMDSVGHADYFPNGGMQQPNCLEHACNHDRAWIYFAESIINNKAFPAFRCKDYEAFKKGDCDDDISYMGLPAEPTASGNYYLQTGRDAPFGLGTRGTEYDKNNY